MRLLAVVALLGFSTASVPQNHWWTDDQIRQMTQSLYSAGLEAIYDGNDACADVLLTASAGFGSPGLTVGWDDNIYHGRAPGSRSWGVYSPASHEIRIVQNPPRSLSGWWFQRGGLNGTIIHEGRHAAGDPTGVIHNQDALHDQCGADYMD